MPAVASPPKEPLNREARVARAKALELPTEYIAPPGDPMSHHAAALARAVCAGVLISGLDADFVVANAGAIPPFDVRKDLGKPVVDAAKKTVDVATPKGVVRSAQFVGVRQGCVVAAESGEPLLCQQRRRRMAAGSARRWCRSLTYVSCALRRQPGWRMADPRSGAAVAARRGALSGETIEGPGLK